MVRLLILIIALSLNSFGAEKIYYVGEKKKNRTDRIEIPHDMRSVDFSNNDELVESVLESGLTLWSEEAIYDGRSGYRAKLHLSPYMNSASGKLVGILSIFNSKNIQEGSTVFLVDTAGPFIITSMSMNWGGPLVPNYDPGRPLQESSLIVESLSKGGAIKLNLTFIQNYEDGSGVSNVNCVFREVTELRTRALNDGDNLNMRGQRDNYNNEIYEVDVSQRLGKQFIGQLAYKGRSANYNKKLLFEPSGIGDLYKLSEIEGGEVKRGFGYGYFESKQANGDISSFKSFGRSFGSIGLISLHTFVKRKVK